MEPLPLMTLVLGVLCFLSFGLGIRFYFVKAEKKTLPMYLVGEMGTAFCLLHLWQLGTAAAQPQARTERWVLALLAYLASWIWYCWALYTVRHTRLTFAYSADRPQTLVETGPYAWVRHPFYTAYTLCFLAAPIATWNPWLLATALVMFIVYRQSAVMEEEKFAKSELATSYLNYSQRTHRFVPLPFGRRLSGQ